MEIEAVVKIGDETVSKVSGEFHRKISQYVQLYIRPRPKWMPEFLWKWLLSRLLVLGKTLPKWKGGPLKNWQKAEHDEDLEYLGSS